MGLKVKVEKVRKDCHIGDQSISRFTVENTYAPKDRYAVAFSAQLKLKKMRTWIDRSPRFINKTKDSHTGYPLFYGGE